MLQKNFNISIKYCNKIFTFQIIESEFDRKSYNLVTCKYYLYYLNNNVASI
jgi:hypothetical protein